LTKLLFNITWEEGEPTVENVSERFKFQPEELDLKFGIVEIDPEENLYSILVEEEAIKRLQEELGVDMPDIEGPFSNLPIGPFGPPSE
jgi:hypothetical protein